MDSPVRVMAVPWRRNAQTCESDSYGTADVGGEARHSIRVSGSATALGDSPDRLLSVSQLSAFLREGVLSVRIPEHEFSHNTLVYQTARDGVAEATDANGKYNINLFNGTPDRRFVWADLPQVSEVEGIRPY